MLLRAFDRPSRASPLKALACVVGLLKTFRMLSLGRLGFQGFFQRALTVVRAPGVSCTGASVPGVLRASGLYASGLEVFKHCVRAFGLRAF